MNFEAYYLLDLLTVIILLIIGLKLAKIKNSLTSVKLTLCWAVLLLSFTIGFIRNVLTLYGGPRNIIQLFITIEFVLNGLIGYFWILYLGEIVIHNFYKKTISYFITAIFPLIYYILLIFNNKFGFLYHFNDEGLFVYGQYHFIMWILTSVDLLTVSIICAIKIFGKEYFGNRGVYLTLASFGPWIIICKLVEKATITPIYPTAISTMVILIFISILESTISKDSLTGINNKNSLIEHLKRLLRTRSNFYFAMIDIDDFKQVNDIYGHLEGDKAIKIVTEILDQFPNFFVARYGGDEFSLVTTYEEMKNTKELINGTLAEYVKKNNLPYELSVSLGYVKNHGQYHTVYDVIKEADINLYEDKKNKKKIKKTGTS